VARSMLIANTRPESDANIAVTDCSAKLMLFYCTIDSDDV
jgi:hypothetical protein